MIALYRPTLGCVLMSIASLSHFGKFLMSIALYRPTLVNVFLSIMLYGKCFIVDRFISSHFGECFIVDRVISSHFGECFIIALYRPTLVTALLSIALSSHFGGAFYCL